MQASLVVLVHINVNGEMCVHESHLVLEALGDANDQVVDEGSDRSEGGDILPGAVVQLDVDEILLGVREVDSQVAEVLREFACRLHQNCASLLPSSTSARKAHTSGTLNCDQSRLNGDLDYARKSR